MYKQECLGQNIIGRLPSAVEGGKLQYEMEHSRCGVETCFSTRPQQSVSSGSSRQSADRVWTTRCWDVCTFALPFTEQAEMLCAHQGHNTQ